MKIFFHKPYSNVEQKTEKKFFSIYMEFQPFFEHKFYILRHTKIGELMKSKKVLAKASALAIAIAINFTACSGIGGTDSCDEVYHPKYKLAKCQKSVGKFKKGKTTHYIHSNGFEFDLTVVKDTTYIEHWDDFCVEAEEEDRSVLLTSSYPIMSVDVKFHGGTDKEMDKSMLGQKHQMKISHGGTAYLIELDSAGSPTSSGIDGDVTMLATITFNGVTYDSVFVIMDSKHYNALNYKDDSFADGKLAHLYFSKKKGILKFETTDNKSFTVKEGDDK